MVKLVAKSACAGLLPLTIGSTTLVAVDDLHMSSIAPFRGKTTAVSAALKAAVGLGFPAPNRSNVAGDARIIWWGHGCAMLCGVSCPAIEGAALTDQSDGWTVVRLSGPFAADVLARLTPVDLRKSQFKTHHTARTLLGHMSVSLTRTGANSFDIMAMRSMAATLVHELERAMKNVAARN